MEIIIKCPIHYVSIYLFRIAHDVLMNLKIIYKHKSNLTQADILIGESRLLRCILLLQN